MAKRGMFATAATRRFSPVVTDRTRDGRARRTSRAAARRPLLSQARMVYVDTLVDYTDDARLPKRMRRWWRHLTADSETELRDFARRIAANASWIQHPGDPDRVHFDLQPRLRAKAIALGAQVETRREMAGRLKAEREARAATAAEAQTGRPEAAAGY
jgi:hypothetical protein